MQYKASDNLNQQIVSEFMNGKTIEQLAAETNLHTAYITLVLYQEGIHYSHKEIFIQTSNNKKSGLA